jgi:hypothetical protein
MAHNTLQIGARLLGGAGARAPTFGIKVNVLTPNEAARLGQVISTMRQTASITPGKNSAPYAFVNVSGTQRDADAVWSRLQMEGFALSPKQWDNDDEKDFSHALARPATATASRHPVLPLAAVNEGNMAGMITAALRGLAPPGASSVQFKVGHSTSLGVESFSLDLSVVYGQHAGRTKFDKSVKRDTFGNVDGPEYDLSPDGTFAGQNIAVLQLYSGEGFTFAAPRAALQRKGFTVHIWTAMPSVAEFEAQLRHSCQLWVISGSVVSLTPAHIAVVQKMVDLKKGLFIWADNDPYTADANALLRGLTQTSELSINGNFMGDTVLTEAAAFGDVGFSSHLVTTGLESLYEGITISSVAGPKAQHRALIRSSDGKVVTACHDRHETRIMIDGGYTRLMEDRWARTAGTARFVTNAACWLFNFEGRPHAKVVAMRAAAKEAAAAPASARSKFKTEICRDWAKGGCPRGRDCSFAHGATEINQSRVNPKFSIRKD